jgi:hypothetical protein
VRLDRVIDTKLSSRHTSSSVYARAGTVKGLSTKAGCLARLPGITPRWPDKGAGKPAAQKRATAKPGLQRPVSKQQSLDL